MNSNNMGWEVVGTGPATQLVETGDGVPYQQAKEKALLGIRACLEPLENRLRELTNDVDLERNKLPVLKGWDSGKRLVIAHTKKRASELVGETVRSFGGYYTPCEGFWWYQFAKEECVWEKQGKWPNEAWVKALSYQEEQEKWKQYWQGEQSREEDLHEL